jgi:hypothetical protein
MAHFYDGCHNAMDVPSSGRRTDTAGNRRLEAGKAVARMAETKEHGAHERELCCMSHFQPYMT